LDYPTGTDSVPSNDLINPDSGNNANFYDLSDYTIGSPYWRTEVGEFENSSSPYGTFDQGGNVWEWNDTITASERRGLRGSGYKWGEEFLTKSGGSSSSPSNQSKGIGLRIGKIREPVANAGIDQMVTDINDNGDEEVTLDGSGSSDSDGNIVSWIWTDDLGDAIPDGEITNAMLSVGTHIITLTVTDNNGLTDSDTVTIAVVPGIVQPVCIEYPTMDFNDDCKVDFTDFAIFVESWLQCNIYPQEACWE
jgi:hypothetical protein